ncbi:MAG: hypothetical protein MI784_03285, partial [Cytophagales bacterium]|nr:hypothetical protein [Cytophagales bacterium]
MKGLFNNYGVLMEKLPKEDDKGKVYPDIFACHDAMERIIFQMNQWGCENLKSSQWNFQSALMSFADNLEEERASVIKRMMYEGEEFFYDARSLTEEQFARASRLWREVFWQKGALRICNDVVYPKAHENRGYRGFRKQFLSYVVRLLSKPESLDWMEELIGAPNPVYCFPLVVVSSGPAVRALVPLDREMGREDVCFSRPAASALVFSPTVNRMGCLEPINEGDETKYFYRPVFIEVAKALLAQALPVSRGMARYNAIGKLTDPDLAFEQHVDESLRRAWEYPLLEGRKEGDAAMQYRYPGGQFFDEAVQKHMLQKMLEQGEIAEEYSREAAARRISDIEAAQERYLTFRSAEYSKTIDSDFKLDWRHPKKIKQAAEGVNRSVYYLEDLSKQKLVIKMGGSENQAGREAFASRFIRTFAKRVSAPVAQVVKINHPDIAFFLKGCATGRNDFLNDPCSTAYKHAVLMTVAEGVPICRREDYAAEWFLRAIGELLFFDLM